MASDGGLKRRHNGASAESAGFPRMERTASMAAINECIRFLEQCPATTTDPNNSPINNIVPAPNFNGRTLEDFTILKQVGRGTYGEVYKAMDKVSHSTVALKKLLVNNCNEGYPVTALREIKIMQHLDHVNIASLDEIVPTAESVNGDDPVYLVMGYMDNDLTGVTKKYKMLLTPDYHRCYMKQLLEAIFYIHKNGVIHRDIKLANILVSNDGRLKLADWGLSRSWKPGQKYTTKVVTLWYRAPELLFNIAHYSTAIDMWSLGCIFVELLTGDAPFRGDTEADMLKRIFRLCGTPNEENWPGISQTPIFKEMKFDELPSILEDKYSKELQPLELDLLKQLLTLDPRKRITAKDALDHDYFWVSQVPKPSDLPPFYGEGSHEYELKLEAKSTLEKMPRFEQVHRDELERRGRNHTYKNMTFNRNTQNSGQPKNKTGQ